MSFVACVVCYLGVEATVLKKIQMELLLRTQGHPLNQGDTKIQGHQIKLLCLKIPFKVVIM